MPLENSQSVDIGKASDGGAVATTGIPIGGNNGSAFQLIKVNSDGELIVKLSEGTIDVGDINVGDVDVASATYEYAADSAHTNSNKGVLQLAVGTIA